MENALIGMSEDLKGAIIGTGYFAQFHADAWNRMPGVAIVAAVDSDLKRAREFARHWGIPAAYGSNEELFGHAKPDFVDIITRPGTHLPLTRLAAEKGAHVICQKPMAPTMDECLEMVRCCNDAGVRLVIHENWRWQPWYREIQRLSEAGRFGSLFHMAFRMRTGDGRGPEPYQQQPYFQEMPRLLIYETLVHFLDTFRFLGGEMESVNCATQRINNAIAGEDYALIQVRFRSGVRGLIDANRISGITPPPVAFGEFRLEGAQASIRMSPEGDLWIRDYGNDDEAAHAFNKPGTGYKGDSALAMQQHFVDCLRSGRAAESEGREYLQTVAAVEACYRSAEADQTQVIV